MTASPASSNPSTASPEKSGRIGLVVFGSIASGFVLGLLLVLVVFAGGEESEITGSALLALGAGFMLLALASSRFTDQPQRWALAPGIAAAVVGLAVLAPRARQPRPWACRLGLAGAASAPRRLVVLGRTPFAPQLVSSRAALPGTLRPFARRVRRCLRDGCGGILKQPCPRGSDLSGQRASSVLELRRDGEPTVVLFNGLGERTPSWAWVQRSLSSKTRVCAFDRAGQGWSGAAAGRQDGHELASDVHGLLMAADISGPYVLAGHSTGGTYALVYAAAVPAGSRRGRPDRLGHAVSVRSPGLSDVLLGMATRLGAASVTFSRRVRTRRARHGLRDAASRRS